MEWAKYFIVVHKSLPVLVLYSFVQTNLLADFRHPFYIQSQVFNLNISYGIQSIVQLTKSNPYS